MPKVACEVFAGFIFVNLAEDPVPLRTFLGDRILELEAYPFDEMTQRYGFSTRIHGNWKLAVDSVCEWYHPPYVHGRFIDPDVSEGREDGAAGRRLPLRRLPPAHAHLGARAAAAAAAGARHGRRARARAALGLQAVPGRPVRPRRHPRHRCAPGVPEQGRIPSWGNDQFWLFPNLSIQIWARNYYITYTYWPESVDSHIYEIDLYFVPPANAHERLAQELVVDSTIEFAMQDVNTIEATHSALATRAQTAVPPERPGAAHPQLPQGHPRHRGARTRQEVESDEHPARGLRRPRAVRRGLGQAHPGRALRRPPVEDRSTSWSSSTTPSPRGPRRPSPTSTRSTSTSCPTTPPGCCSSSTR